MVEGRHTESTDILKGKTLLRRMVSVAQRAQVLIQHIGRRTEHLPEAVFRHETRILRVGEGQRPVRVETDLRTAAAPKGTHDGAVRIELHVAELPTTVAQTRQGAQTRRVVPRLTIRATEGARADELELLFDPKVEERCQHHGVVLTGLENKRRATDILVAPPPLPLHEVLMVASHHQHL